VFYKNNKEEFYEIITNNLEIDDFIEVKTRIEEDKKVFTSYLSKDSKNPNTILVFLPETLIPDVAEPFYLVSYINDLRDYSGKLIQATDIVSLKNGPDSINYTKDEKVLMAFSYCATNILKTIEVRESQLN